MAFVNIPHIWITSGDFNQDSSTELSLAKMLAGVFSVTGQPHPERRTREGVIKATPSVNPIAISPLDLRAGLAPAFRTETTWQVLVGCLASANAIVREPTTQRR